MTLEKLKRIVDNLPAATVLLVEDDNGNQNDVETVFVEYHDDGRAHLILSNKE